MASVSKINFNGSVLDIKDSRARDQLTHLTADNYTADVAGDYTVNGGDIAMSSKNFTGHTTADREIDTDGNDSVHIDGASTLNVGGLRTETFAGDKTETVKGTVAEKFNNVNTTVTGKWMINTPSRSFNIADVALKTDVPTLPILDMTQHGVNTDAEDNAAAINSIITTYGDSYTLYLKKGTYNIKSPILINRNDTHIICDGVIHSTGDAIIITSSDNILTFAALTGNNTGTGVLMQSGVTAIGNSIINIPRIDYFTTGIRLLSGAAGIMNNVFNLLRIDRFTTGIEIACDNSGKGWVNENKFYNCWCFGYTATETAVKFTKGGAQTDPFNGNRFVNFSGEGCKTLFNLNFACRNTFENFRLIEQSLTDTIICSADSQDNIFSSDNSMLDYTCINDKGENNIYNILFYDGGSKLCRQMITIQGLLMATNHAPYYANSSYVFTKSGFIPGHKIATWITITNSTTADMTVVLPLTADFPQIGATFTIETGDLNGKTTVIGYGSELIASSTDASGSAKIQLKPWHKYIFNIVGYNTYKVFDVASSA